MEQLTKQQVTLLCLLVALFTSITTSVITASLFDDTSQGVSQTILRVVEKTIQEVAPKDDVAKKGDETKKDKPETITNVSLSDIVEKANGSIVGIYSENGTDTMTYISSGVVVGSHDSIVALNGLSISEGAKYVVKLSDGKTVKMKRNTTVVLPSGMALLTYAPGEVSRPKLTGLNFISLANEKLASNIIALGSKEQNNVVSTGIITEFVQEGTDPEKMIKNIAITDVKLSAASSGWILLNSSGKLIGFITQGVEGDKGARYLNVDLVQSLSKELF